MYFDNNFLFFVTVTATLDESRRSSPDDNFLTNRKQSLIRSKQTPDPSVQCLVNMQTIGKFNADEQLRIG